MLTQPDFYNLLWLVTKLMLFNLALTQMLPLIKQPLLNIATLGSPDSGKTTTTVFLAGAITQHSQERKRNVTMQIGYKNGRIWRLPNGDLVTQDASAAPPDESSTPEFLFSMVDAPGHQEYQTTSTGAAFLADAFLLLVGANQEIPNRQLLQHIELIRTFIKPNNCLLLFNKIDLIGTTEELTGRLDKLRRFIDEQLPGEEIPIIPVSITKKINIQFMLKSLLNLMRANVAPTLQDEGQHAPNVVQVLRSFEVGDEQAAVGGAILSGSFKTGDLIKLSPGIIYQNQIQPIYSRIMSIQTGQTSIHQAFTGGSVAFGLLIDSSLTAKNRMVGQLITLENEASMPIMDTVQIATQIDTRDAMPGQEFLINFGSLAVSAVYLGQLESDADIKGFELKTPICPAGPKCMIGTVDNQLLGVGEICPPKLSVKVELDRNDFDVSELPKKDERVLIQVMESGEVELQTWATFESLEIKKREQYLRIYLDNPIAYPEDNRVKIVQYDIWGRIATKKKTKDKTKDHPSESVVKPTGLYRFKLIDPIWKPDDFPEVETSVAPSNPSPEIAKALLDITRHTTLSAEHQVHEMFFDLIRMNRIKRLPVIDFTLTTTHSTEELLADTRTHVPSGAEAHISPETRKISTQQALWINIQDVASSLTYQYSDMPGMPSSFKPVDVKWLLINFTRNLYSSDKKVSFQTNNDGLVIKGSGFNDKTLKGVCDNFVKDVICCRQCKYNKCSMISYHGSHMSRKANYSRYCPSCHTLGSLDQSLLD